MADEKPKQSKLRKSKHAKELIDYLESVGVREDRIDFELDNRVPCVVMQDKVWSSEGKLMKKDKACLKLEDFEALSVNEFVMEL